jgi:hypothetical protein
MIFTIRTRNRRVRAVEFVCPRCGLDRPGGHDVPRKWLRFAGMPVLPLAELAPTVTCDECGHVSDLGVLEVPTTAQLAELLRDATVAALVMTVRSSTDEARGTVHDAAVDELRRAGFREEALCFARSVEQLDDAEARRRLRRVAPELTSYGKQAFLHRVASVADVVDPPQRGALALIGCELGMAAPHINGVLAVSAAA